MQNILKNTPDNRQKKQAIKYVLIWFFVIFILMFLGNQSSIDQNDLSQTNPIILLVFQGVFSIIFFIGIPLLFIFKILKFNVSFFLKKISVLEIILVLIIMMGMMIVNSALVEWNLKIDLPNSQFEDWTKEMEKSIKILTDYLTTFDSFTHFILAIIVIAIIPAVGEELLFRGIFQNLMLKVSNNHHIAIWTTGMFFAAIHLQFYGFFPRMLLGTLFGYLYYWSGKLSIAMLAHFFNNIFALILITLIQKNIIEMSIDDLETSMPWAVIISVCIGIVYVINIFIKNYKTNNE